MRSLLGLLVLLALCGGAWYWQAEWTDRVRSERESRLGAPSTLAGREASWGKIHIGRPSGAEPLELEQPVMVHGFNEDQANAPELPSLFGSEVHAGDGPTLAPQVPKDFEYIVPAGRVLSQICEDFYGSGRSPIPEQVATYNGLKSPDSLRAGFELRLPEWDKLFPE
ncbi:MAG: hypothetical protein ACI9F9_001061 [Candidatus Paceibacteria bacterium]